MEEFSMSKETLKEIIGRYLDKPFFVGMDSSDIEYIFDLVEELMTAEKKAMEVKEPYATRGIDNLEIARREVFMMGLDIGDAFEEVYNNVSV